MAARSILYVVTKNMILCREYTHQGWTLHKPSLKAKGKKKKELIRKAANENSVCQDQSSGNIFFQN